MNNGIHNEMNNQNKHEHEMKWNEWMEIQMEMKINEMKIK